MRRLAMALLLLVIGMPDAFAQVPGDGCAQAFPQVGFGITRSGGSVEVSASGLDLAVVERFTASVAEFAGILEAEVAPMGGVAVCLFADELPLTPQDVGREGNLPLRAVAMGADDLLLVSAWSIRTVDDALLEGLVHIALWRAVGGGYPEPFATEVTGWYSARLSGTTSIAHSIMLRQNVGLREPMPPNDWVAGTAADTIVWNPENPYGGLGDFAGFVFAEAGPGVFADPAPEALAGLDERWRNALFDESGAIPGGSKGWIVGLAIAGGIVLVAIGLAWWTRLVRRRVLEEIRAAALEGRTLGGSGVEHPPPPDVRAAVGRPLSGQRRRRRNPGVRRGVDRAATDADDGNGAPSGRPVGGEADDVAPGGESGDDLFRHPGFDADD